MKIPILLRVLLFLLLVLGMNNTAFSQVIPQPEPDYTKVNKKKHHRSYTEPRDVINSNRPGFSVSPYNVGEGIFQIESGLMGNTELLGINGKDGSIKSFGIDVSLRYAVDSRFEIYTNFSTNQKRYDVDSITSSSFIFTPAVLGLSYRINEGEKFIPTMAIRGGLTYYKDYQENAESDITVIFSTQHDLASNWIFITNWKADKIIANTELGAILALTNTITPDWSWFTEYYGTYTNSTFNNFINVGMAYLLNDDIQLDVFGGTNLDINKTTYYLSVGVSWRLDTRRKKMNPPRGSSRVDHGVYREYRNKGVK